MGYYAKAKNGNLYQFEWSEDNKFLVQVMENSKNYIEQDITDYEIIEVEQITADSK